MINVLGYQFFQHAMLAAFLASIVCGLIGVIIVEKELIMMSGGIAHTSYGGIGLGYLLGFEPIIGAFLMAIAAALGIGYIERQGGTHTDVVIALFWSLGMALGILFIGMMPGYPPDIASYLFGSILSVTRTDLFLMLTLSVSILILIVVIFDYWKAYLFDGQFSRIIGVRTDLLQYLLLVMIAMSVVVLIRVVGIILILALFTAPPAIAQFYARSLRGRMILSIVIGLVLSWGGLWLSYQFNVASGALIVTLSVLLYLLVYVVKRGRFKKRVSQNEVTK